jgi:4-hydroxybenzoate polyprenyltransferase
VLLDVLVLAMLYTLRIVAGSAAVAVTTSVWLLTFSVFFFFSLALTKRCAELVALHSAELAATPGRDYQVRDLTVLWPMGIGASLCAVVVFTLFANAVATETRYATPQLLWLVAIGLIYWLGRVWIKTARGEMHDDPIVYALRDFASCMTLMAMLAATLGAHFLPLR